jgi:hypothetical protein
MAGGMKAAVAVGTGATAVFAAFLKKLPDAMKGALLRKVQKEGMERLMTHHGETFAHAFAEVAQTTMDTALDRGYQNAARILGELAENQATRHITEELSALSTTELAKCLGGLARCCKNGSRKSTEFVEKILKNDKIFREYPAGTRARLLKKIDAEATNVGPAGPGKWGKSGEFPRDRPALYEALVTGRFPQEAYRIKNTNFDGFDFARNVLLDAKGLGMEWMVKSGVFKRDMYIRTDFLTRATKQLKALKDAGSSCPIEWHFASRSVADATIALFQEKGITGITVLFKPIL